jgi:hypothetical protein
MMKPLLLPLALVACLTSGCTLGGIMAAARDSQDPSREGHPILDIVAGIAMDAVAIGAVAYATKDLGPFGGGTYSDGQ